MPPSSSSTATRPLIAEMAGMHVAFLVDVGLQGKAAPLRKFFSQRVENEGCYCCRVSPIVVYALACEVVCLSCSTEFCACLACLRRRCNCIYNPEQLGPVLTACASGSATFGKSIWNPL